MKHVAFGGRLVMLGFGSIGQGVLPLILRHIDMPRGADLASFPVTSAGGMWRPNSAWAFTVRPLTRDNYRRCAGAAAAGRGFPAEPERRCVVGGADRASARSVDVLYLDTCIEPWAGGYTDPSLTPSQRSNYALRESALALARWQRARRRC